MKLIISRPHQLSRSSLFSYTLSSPYNITSAVLSFTFDVAKSNTWLQGLTFNSTGDKLFILYQKNFLEPIAVDIYQLSNTNKQKGFNKFYLKKKKD